MRPPFTCTVRLTRHVPVYPYPYPSPVQVTRSVLVPVLVRPTRSYHSRIRAQPPEEAPACPIYLTTPAVPALQRHVPTFPYQTEARTPAFITLNPRLTLIVHPRAHIPNYAAYTRERLQHTLRHSHTNVHDVVHSSYPASTYTLTRTPALPTPLLYTIATFVHIPPFASRTHSPTR